MSAKPQSQAARSLGRLSVVVPVLDEAETLNAFHERVVEALSAFEWEAIFVDDGSRDETPAVLELIARSDPRVRWIRLSRNFGHQAALTAGLDHISGDVAVTIDADLQDPPELIPEMVDTWQQGADVVHAVRARRSGEPWWRLALIRAFYRLFARFAESASVGNSGDFRLIDRRALEVLGGMRERNRFLRGMTVWVGFDQATVEYDRDPRFAGETKYPLGKLITLAFDGIVSFSQVPLRIAAVLGLVASFLAIAAVPAVVALKIAGLYVPGIASVLIVLLLLGGVQLMTLGLIGEYIGRSYDEVKQRPIYVVASRSDSGEAMALTRGSDGVTEHSRVANET